MLKIITAALLVYTVGCSGGEEYSLSDGSGNETNQATNPKFKCSNLSSPPFLYGERPSLASYDGKMIVFGNDISRRRVGETRSSVRGAIFDPKNDSWSTIPDPTFATGGATKIAVVGNDLYLFGLLKGFLVAGVYSFPEDNWKQIELPDGIRHPGGSLAYGDYLNGFSVGTFESGTKIMINAIRNGYYDYSNAYHFSYDPKQNQWTPKRSMAFKAHMGMAINIGDEVYFAGSWASGVVKILNLDSGKKRSLEDVPNLISSSAAAVGNQLVVWGGVTQTYGEVPADQGYIYNTNDNSVTALPDSPFLPRRSHGATTIGNKVIFWGGLTQEKSGPGITVGESGRRVLNDGAVFDMVEKQWICKQ